MGSRPLAEADPELADLVTKERGRQTEGIELIASEVVSLCMIMLIIQNFTSAAVLDCLGSCLTNKYAEGYPGARYETNTTFLLISDQLLRR